MVPSDTKSQSDQNKTVRDVLGGLWVLGRVFGHEFHALLIFQKFLISCRLRNVERRPVLCFFKRIEGGSVYQKKKNLLRKIRL